MINFNIEHVSVTSIKDANDRDLVCTHSPADGNYHLATRFVNYKRMWLGFAACDDDYHLAGAINWMLDPTAGFALELGA
jgi:hypothetical protein